MCQLIGVGSFTIIDSALVTPQDIGNNFFLLPEQIGLSRAKCVTELLQELNEDVDGHYLEEDPVKLVEDHPALLEGFTIAIITGVQGAELAKLASFFWERNIPVVIVKINGFLASMRLAVQEHNSAWRFISSVLIRN